MVHRILRNRMLNATKVGARMPLNSKAQAGFDAMAHGILEGVPSPKPTQVLHSLQRVPLPADTSLGFLTRSATLVRDCQSPERTERQEKRTANKYWPQACTRDGSRGK